MTALYLHEYLYLYDSFIFAEQFYCITCYISKTWQFNIQIPVLFLHDMVVFDTMVCLYLLRLLLSYWVLLHYMLSKSWNFNSILQIFVSVYKKPFFFINSTHYKPTEECTGGPNGLASVSL